MHPVPIAQQLAGRYTSIRTNWSIFSRRQKNNTNMTFSVTTRTIWKRYHPGLIKSGNTAVAGILDHCIKPGLYSMRAYAHVYAPIVGAAVYTSVAGCAQRIRAHTPTIAVKVQTCWTFKASADKRRHSSQSRKRSKVTEGRRVVLHRDVCGLYRCIRSPVYTFIHGATCAMQWRCTGSRKRGHLRWLPAHMRAWSINPALCISAQHPKKPKRTIMQWSKVDWEAVKEESCKFQDDFLSHHNERTVDKNYEAFCQHVNDFITSQVPMQQSFKA